MTDPVQQEAKQALGANLDYAKVLLDAERWVEAQPELGLWDDPTLGIYLDGFRAAAESRDQRIQRLAEVAEAASHLIDGWDYYVELVEMGFPPANALETALDALLPGDLDV